jgi:hypothetical protein
VLRARRLRGGRYGYLRIFSFNVAAPEIFVVECERLLTELPADGLVIDVRGNGGGSITAAEGLLQLLSPVPIEPERAQFIASSANLQLCRADAADAGIAGLDLRPWQPSLNSAIGTGAPYSFAFPISDVTFVHSQTQGYAAPKVLVVDPLSYSATDIFAAGFADHNLGLILGVGQTTGAGGANVWSHRTLRAIFDASARAAPDSQPDKHLEQSPYAPLPFGSDIRVAIRRTLRIGTHAGEMVEDFGVTPDDSTALTADDLLHGNRDLLARAVKLLQLQPRRALTVTVPTHGATPHLKVTATGVDRIDVNVGDWQLPSTPYRRQPIEIDLRSYHGPPGRDLDVDVVGVADDVTVVRRRLRLSLPHR